MPNSMTQLNAFSSTAVEFEDERPYAIAFSAGAAANTSISIVEDQTFVVPTGIDIVSVFSQPGPITYTVSATGIGNVVGTWPTPLPNGISNTSSGNVFRITGFFTSDTWELARNLALVCPDRKTGFSFGASLAYPNPANVAQNATWNWTNSVAVTETNPDLSLTTSYNWAEDQLTQFVYSVEDLDPTATYTLTFDQVTGTDGIITVNGISPGIGNTATITGNRAVVNGANVVFNPFPDATDNVTVLVSASKTNPFGTTVFANNTVTTLNCTSTHAEYNFASTQYRTNNVDRVNFAITDQAGADTAYTVVIQDVTAAPGRFYFNGAWQANNSITLSGTKTTINSAVVWYEPVDDFSGNVSLQYSQSRTSAVYPTPFVQAQQVPFTLTPAEQYVVNNQYNFSSDATAPVNLTQTLVDNSQQFTETAAYNVNFSQSDPAITIFNSPAWATGTAPPVNVTTWTSRTSGTTGGLYDVAWTGSQYVLVGGNFGTFQTGLVRTSPNGITWTATSAPANVLSTVIWDGVKLVASGGAGIMTSSDAVTWTTRNSTPGFQDMTWTGSLFVAVASNNVILSSSDGITWTQRSSSASRVFNGVTWSGNQFVAVGAEGSGGGLAGFVRTSADGITWSSQIIPNVPGLRDVTWSGNQFVAVGNSGTIITSPDGITWSSQVSSAQGNESVTLMAVEFSNGQFNVVGGLNGQVWTSSDGVNWSDTTPMFGFNNRIRNVNNLLFALGESGRLFSRGSDSDRAATNITIPAATRLGINALTSTPPLRYYRNSTVPNSTITLRYNLSKTRSEPGHPYQNQSRIVVSNLPITLTKV